MLPKRYPSLKETVKGERGKLVAICSATKTPTRTGHVLVGVLPSDPLKHVLWATGNGKRSLVDSVGECKKQARFEPECVVCRA